MKRTLRITVFLLGLFTSWGQANAACDTDAIFRWAPVIYQQGNEQNVLAKENVFTRVNFDRDWRANNNAYNLPYYATDMAIYYSVVATDTHYFLGYYLYYPRHGGRDPYDHDMIGVLLVVGKEAEGFNRLERVVTYSNKQWRQWAGDQARVERGHVVLKVSAGAHDLLALKVTQGAPEGVGMYPQPMIAVFDRGHPGYRLIDLDELWQRRLDNGPGRTFSRWGYFDSYNDRDATAPWSWEYKGANWLTKPAELIRILQGIPVTPESYIKNPYL